MHWRVCSLRLGLAVLGAVAGAAAAAPNATPPARTFRFPPKAIAVTGQIHEITLSPIYRTDFMCSQHFNGQLAYAGDALGSDCMIVGGVQGDSGFLRPFRTDGKTNEDWYGWKAPVLAPVTGGVVGVFQKGEVNVPGTMGKPPAGMIQIRTDAGVIVVLAHVTELQVRPGDAVRAGQQVAQVGNNGFARAPHIHVGAYVEATAEPLQIRWDLNALRDAASGNS